MAISGDIRKRCVSQHYAHDGYGLKRRWQNRDLLDITERRYSIGYWRLKLGDDKAQVAKANQAGLAVQALSRWRESGLPERGAFYCRLPILLPLAWRNRSHGSCDRR